MAFLAPMCDCGHTRDQHMASITYPSYCLVKDCGCPDFKDVALATKVEKAEER